jgi:glycosyltransferase involved in cell wall biosynthesis
MVETGFPEDKIQVHYIGVDTEYFQPAPNVTRQQTVLFVGRLSEKKGCSILIEAMALVQAKLPGSELVIIGDGHQRSLLEEMAHRLLRKFRFLGKQPPSVIREWMQNSSVFSVPSITAQTGDAEGFGIVFAEAQACELPVVSFESGGIPEAVQHGETGFLVPEGDRQGLARELLRVLEDQGLAARLGRAGRLRVHEKFSLAKQSLLLEDIYDEVAADFTAPVMTI